MTTCIELENNFWRVGVLPETGAAMSYGLIQRNNRWLDIFRPTAEVDYGNVSLCANFPLIPWFGHIKDARFTFEGKSYTLRSNHPSGNAVHGVCRNLPWKVEKATGGMVHLRFHSRDFGEVNFPFHFSAEQTFQLHDNTLEMILTLWNEDDQAMPGGFGHHPYFQKALDSGTEVRVEIPAESWVEAENVIPVKASAPVPPPVDFRRPRPLEVPQEVTFLTGRHPEKPIRLIYPEAELQMWADSTFEYVVVYVPQGKSFYAVEPVSLVSEGFNHFAQGKPGTGVFVLQPGESRTASMRIQLV